MSKARKGGWRTSETGSLRFNRDFSRIGVGRITCSARTKNLTELGRRNGILTKLAEDGQIDVLLALKDGRLSIEELVAADRENRLRGSDLLTELRLRANLWETIALTLPRLAPTERSRRRYEVSFRALQRKGADWLPSNATVADLPRVDWKALQGIWDRSAADWNHIRRALSAFLTCLLDDKHHPVRRKVMRVFPLAKEMPRVPDISLDTFARIVEHASPTVRPVLIVLAMTGMRVGEFLNCTEEHLNAETCVIRIPGTKTAASAAPLPVPEEAWPYVVAAIPSPLQYKALRGHFKAACERAGVRDARLHDLRHCFAQWGTNAGLTQNQIQSALRHVSPAQTLQYSRQRDRGEAAKTVSQLVARALA